jgi:hypothetical protein
MPEKMGERNGDQVSPPLPGQSINLLRHIFQFPLCLQFSYELLLLPAVFNQALIFIE